MTGIVAFALRSRGLVVVFFGIILLAGAFCFRLLNIEAYPDPVPPLVDVVTQSTGQSAEEIERYITIPLEVQLAGIPHVTSVRTISLFGLSDVKVQFTYDYTYDQAEQQVLNRLSQLTPLPNGAQPGISPESPTGEIYRYRLVGPPGFDLTDLKTLQDWVIQRRFRAVPGVVDVTGWGGLTKTYDVTVDLARLQSSGLTLAQVVTALNNGNGNVGGDVMSIGEEAAVVRGVGLMQSMDDVRNTVLTQTNGTPVLLSDVATVKVGHEPRLGISGQDDEDDIVQGIVLMRRGAETLPTLKLVEAEVEKMNTTGILPPGVHLVPYYDRTALIHVTTSTVMENVLTGIALIFLVQWVFLGNIRTAIVVAATIPFALSVALIVMTLRGESANLLSVGAIDFGLIVDAAVLMVENIFRHLAESDAGHDPTRTRQVKRGLWLPGRLGVMQGAAGEVGRSIFFCAAIIIAAFVPLFGLGGIEGHIFSPMAKTYAYALIGALTCAFTVSPALSALLLPLHLEERETLIVRGIRRLYMPLLRVALNNRIITLGGAVLLAAFCVLAARGLQLEFLPKLEEGNLWIRATLPAAISLEASDAAANRLRRVIKSFPEVETVISQHGRPDDGTDTTGPFNVEYYVPLKPPGQWPSGVDKQSLTDAVLAKMQDVYPGIELNASQNIQDNVEEAASGVKGENSVKVFGPDLKMLEATAGHIKDILRQTAGVTDLAVDASLGQPTVTITIDRARAARYGLASSDINATVQAAIGGEAAGDLYEPGSDRHFPMVIRLAPRYRESLAAIGNITISTQGTGGTILVPLSEIADIKLTTGAAFIYREQQERYVPVKFSVRNRDVGGAVLEAERRVAEEVRLPPGVHLEWVGEVQNLQDAIARLSVLVPISIGLILFLLYGLFGSLKDMLLAGSVIPMAMIGGVLTLVVTNTPFSVSAAIGFVALLGIAVMDGVILLSYYRQLRFDGVVGREAILLTCSVRMRPAVMTSVAACVGLLPAAVSTGIGSQVQHPLAVVVVGGILLAPVLILVVLPVLIEVFTAREAAAVQPAAGLQPAAGE
jgi:heavy metal efflux system protein